MSIYRNEMIRHGISDTIVHCGGSAVNNNSEEKDRGRTVMFQGCVGASIV